MLVKIEMIRILHCNMPKLFPHLAYLEHLFMLLDLDLYINTLHKAMFYLHASFFSIPVFCTFFLWLCIGFLRFSLLHKPYPLFF